MNEPRTPPPPASVTPSGILVPPVVTREMSADAELGEPGQPPYTRSIFADGYRGRLWTFRQYSGFGSAEETNERYRFLLQQGTTGLSVALDLPTQCGYDPDDPMSAGEIGKVGVSLASLAEAELLFGGIDLSKISTSFTINGTAAIIYALYLAVADKAGVARTTLTGTIQNDILKEYVARGTWIFPIRSSMRLIADTILYSAEQTPRFNPISIAGAHVRDAGSTAAEEMGYTLANGLAYVTELVNRGADPNRIAQRLSFFFYVHMDLFEEVAKFRAGRRLWAKLLQERFKVSDPKALMFRFGVVCGGSSLTAAQPYNNIIRVAIENIAAVLGGAQSIFTCAYDEAFQIPTEFSAELAIRTQQIVAYESGLPRTVDPLGGGYYIEWLTDRMEEQMRTIIRALDDQGGVERAIEEGYVQARVAQSAYRRKQRKDSGEDVVVGENYFHNAASQDDFGEIFTMNDACADLVLSRLAEVRSSRNAARVRSCLDRLDTAARSKNENVMPYLVDCCHAYVTVGEMVSRLKQLWGEFKEPIRFGG
jgi:methylmalonyl-CoA mutase N-terminal domain/subunit